MIYIYALLLAVLSLCPAAAQKITVPNPVFAGVPNTTSFLGGLPPWQVNVFDTKGNFALTISKTPPHSLSFCLIPRPFKAAKTNSSASSQQHKTFSSLSRLTSTPLPTRSSRATPTSSVVQTQLASRSTAHHSSSPSVYAHALPLPRRRVWRQAPHRVVLRHLL